MAHEAFRACLAYHDHAITALQFAGVINRLFSRPQWDKIYALVLLCGGS